MIFPSCFYYLDCYLSWNGPLRTLSTTLCSFILDLIHIIVIIYSFKRGVERPSNGQIMLDPQSDNNSHLICVFVVCLLPPLSLHLLRRPRIDRFFHSSSSTVQRRVLSMETPYGRQMNQHSDRYISRSNHLSFLSQPFDGCSLPRFKDQPALMITACSILASSLKFAISHLRCNDL